MNKADEVDTEEIYVEEYYEEILNIAREDNIKHPSTSLENNSCKLILKDVNANVIGEISIYEEMEDYERIMEIIV